MTEVIKKVIKTILKIIVILLVCLILLYLFLMGKSDDHTDKNGVYAHIDSGHSFAHICSHPGLYGLGEDVLPWDGSFLNTIAKPLKLKLLIPFLGKHEDTIVDSINYTIDRYQDGSASFLPYYSEEEIAADAGKTDTGLVYYHTADGAPFVLICPGGSFTFVGVVSSGYPYVKTLQDAGFNVFILEYRVGTRKGEESKAPAADRANEDLLAAAKYIFAHAQELGVSSEDYLILGSSAGGQMTARYCAEGRYAEYGIPAPAGCIMLYPANCQLFDYSGCSIPMFITVCADDPQINVDGLDAAVEAMKAAEMEVSYTKFETGGHSFGLGVGTPAEGWLDRAIQWMQPYLSR